MQALSGGRGGPKYLSYARIDPPALAALTQKPTRALWRPPASAPAAPPKAMATFRTVCCPQSAFFVLSDGLVAGTRGARRFSGLSGHYEGVFPSRAQVRSGAPNDAPDDHVHHL